MVEPLISLIAVGQLREEIGAPTDLQSVPGHVLDANLQAIIDEVSNAYAEAGLAKAESQGLGGMTVENGEALAVKLERSGHSHKMAHGKIPQTHFPYVFHAYAPDGTPLVHDGQIDVSAQTEPWPGVYHRFDVRDEEVFVLPRTLTSASFFVPTRKAVVSFVMAGEVPKYNGLIIDRAREMLASLIKEQTRLESGEMMEED